MRKKKSVVQKATSPIADFLQKLPRKAVVLGFRIRRSPERTDLLLAYLFNGSKVVTSISTEGGSV